MTVPDDDGELVEDTAEITRIEWDESNSGNEYLALYARPSYAPAGADNTENKYWVWSEDWQQELTNREDFYTGTKFKIIHVKKYPAYWPFKYLEPVNQEDREEWVQINKEK